MYLYEFCLPHGTIYLSNPYMVCACYIGCFDFSQSTYPNAFPQVDSLLAKNESKVSTQSIDLLLPINSTMDGWPQHLAM
jgi:hypothetical protein